MALGVVNANSKGSPAQPLNPNTQSRPNSKGGPLQPRDPANPYASYNTGTPTTPATTPMGGTTGNPLGTPAASPTAPPATTTLPREMAFLARGVPPGLGDPVRGGMSEQARLAQQRRNNSFSRAQAPQFNQFTGNGAKYIGAQDGEVLYDYGNGQYRKGTNPNNMRDVQGNWTFLRS